MRNVLLASAFLFIVASIALATERAASAAQAQSTAAAKKAASIHAGEDVFTKRCLQCHSVYEGQTGFGPNLYKEMKKPHPKKTTSQVRVIIKNGKGKMPGFDGKLTDEETDNLMSYLQTL